MHICGYEPANNIISIVNNSNNQSFSYDALNRLITANGGYGNLGYGYDAVGNRLIETRNGNNHTYQYAATSNRLTGITRASGNRNFTYDAAGNPIQRTADDNNTQTYSFNKANRLSSVSVNGTQAATYTYNPLGQRVLKALANGTREIYLYDESGQLIAVLDGAGVTTREYIYRGNQQIVLVNNGTTYYIHNDHLNTPQVITNQSQQVVWMGDYEPFGKVASHTSNSIEIFSRFPGQYLDGETGLYYNYFRDYDPSIGRYIESDPIGLGGGINTYAYAHQNPIKNSDFFGLLVQMCHRPADLPWPANKADHYWWKTDTYEAGMGETNKPNQIPGQGNSGLPFTPVSTVDHTGQSTQSNSVCSEPKVELDEECVNQIIKPGQSQGYFLPPFNDCRNIIIEVVIKCRKKKS